MFDNETILVCNNAVIALNHNQHGWVIENLYSKTGHNRLKVQGPMLNISSDNYSKLGFIYPLARFQINQTF